MFTKLWHINLISEYVVLAAPREMTHEELVSVWPSVYFISARRNGSRQNSVFRGYQ